MVGNEHEVEFCIGHRQLCDDVKLAVTPAGAQAVAAKGTELPSSLRCCGASGVSPGEGPWSGRRTVGIPLQGYWNTRPGPRSSRHAVGSRPGTHSLRPPPHDTWLASSVRDGSPSQSRWSRSLPGQGEHSTPQPHSGPLPVSGHWPLPAVDWQRGVVARHCQGRIERVHDVPSRLAPHLPPTTRQAGRMQPGGVPGRRGTRTESPRRLRHPPTDAVLPAAPAPGPPRPRAARRPAAAAPSPAARQSARGRQPGYPRSAARRGPT